MAGLKLTTSDQEIPCFINQSEINGNKSLISIIVGASSSLDKANTIENDNNSVYRVLKEHVDT